MLVQTILAPPLLALLLCLHLGYAWSRALLPVELQPYRALIMPLLGLALLIQTTAALTTTTALTPPQIAAGLALLAVPLNVWAFFRAARPVRDRAEWWPLLVVAAWALLAFVIAILPLLRWNLSAPIGSNWDGAEFYVPLGRALQLRSQRDLATLPRNPLIQILTTPPVSGRIHAFSYLHAAAGSGARVDPLGSYAPMMAWTLALQPLAVYPLARVVRLARWTALLGTLLAALAWLPLWVAYNNFSNHLLALPLLPIALASSMLVLCTKSWRALVTGALFAGGLATAYYPAMTAFVALFAPAALYLLWRSSARLHVFGRGLALAALAILLSAAAQYAFWLREGFLDEMLRRGTGFQVTEFVDLRSALGLAATFNRESVISGAALVWIALVLAIGLGVAAIMGRRAPLLVAMLLGAAAYQGVTAAQVYYYGFYKGITFAIPIIALSVVAGAEAAWKVGPLRSAWRASFRAAIAGALALIVGLNAVTVWRVQARYSAAGPQLWTRAELAALEVAREVPPAASVLLQPSSAYPPTFASLLSYLLIGHELRGRISTGYTTIDSGSGAQPADAALIAEDEPPAAYGYQPDQLVWAGAKMRLYRRAANVRYHRAFAPAPTLAPGAAITLRLGADAIALPDEPPPQPVSVQPERLTLALAGFALTTIEVRAAGASEQYTLNGGAIEVTPAAIAATIEVRNTGTAPLYLQWAELRDAGAPPGVVPRDTVFVQAQPQTDAATEIMVYAPALPAAAQKLTGLLTVTQRADETAQPQEIGRWVFFPAGGQRLRLAADFVQPGVTLTEGDQPRDLFGSAQSAGDGLYEMTLLLANNAQIVYATQLWSWRVADGAAMEVAANSVPFEVVALPQPATVREAVLRDGTLRLRGYTLAPARAQRGANIQPSIVWQSLGKIADDLQAQATVIDGRGRVIAEQTLPLGAPDHGTSTWVEGEIAEQTFDLPIAPTVSPGSLTLRVAIVDAQGQPLGWAERDGPLPITEIEAR